MCGWMCVDVNLRLQASPLHGVFPWSWRMEPQAPAYFRWFSETPGPDREHCWQCKCQPDSLPKTPVPSHALCVVCSSWSSHFQMGCMFSTLTLKMPSGLWTLFCELGLFQLVCVSPKVELGFAVCHDTHIHNVASGWWNPNFRQHALILWSFKESHFYLFKVSDFGDDLYFQLLLPLWCLIINAA